MMVDEDDLFVAKLIIGSLLALGLFGFLVYWFFVRDPGPTPDPDVPPPQPPPQCSFEGQDTFNQKIVDAKGNLVLPDTLVDCSNCASYTYKDKDGCVPLGYDSTQVAAVCQAGFRNATGNWSVPPSKKC
jgi:hypothetical protein